MIKPMLRAVVTYFIFRAEIPAFLHMCAGRCRKMKTVRFFKKQDQLISSISNSSNVGLTHTHTCDNTHTCVQHKLCICLHYCQRQTRGLRESLSIPERDRDQREQLEREKEKESDTRKSFSAPRALSCCGLGGHSSTCSAHTCSQVDAVSLLWCVDICSAFCTVELSLLTCMGVRRRSWQMRAGMGANVIVH
jgi:hypothetical protein